MEGVDWNSIITKAKYYRKQRLEIPKLNDQLHSFIAGFTSFESLDQ